MVARVGESFLTEELFLNQARADEAAEGIGATSLVVSATSTGTTEGLLSNKSSGCLAVCERIWLVSKFEWDHGDGGDLLM